MYKECARGWTGGCNAENKVAYHRVSGGEKLNGNSGIVAASTIDTAAVNIEPDSESR